MMKDWNTTGRIKAIVLGLVAVGNLLTPGGAQGPEGLAMILVPLIFGSIAVPLTAKIHGALFGAETVKPNWNDNPITLKRPLSLFQFGSLLFLTTGLSVTIGTGVRSQTVNFLGLFIISFGLGILIGIWLSLKWTRTKV